MTGLKQIMKKAERLNQELIYLQDKRYFHLHDLETKFNISERTALRDLQDLDHIGLAFYSNPGRNGGYCLLNNRLALPIRFKTEEINATFFALQSIKKITVTPYSHNYEQIKEKLLQSFPSQLRQQIIRQQKAVHFYSQPSLNSVPFFKDLLKACLNNEVITAVNPQFVKEKQDLQLFDLFYQTGNWFCHAYNLKLKKWFILRLDKFKEVHLSTPRTSNLMSKTELQESFLNYQKQYHYLTYKCQLSHEGENRIRFNSYPDMKIIHQKGQIYLQGKFNPDEEEYLVDYFLSLGNEIKVIKPATLRQAYVEELQTILRHYK